MATILLEKSGHKDYFSDTRIYSQEVQHAKLVYFNHRCTYLDIVRLWWRELIYRLNQNSRMRLSGPLLRGLGNGKVGTKGFGAITKPGTGSEDV